MNKYYQILELTPGASRDEIKAAYRRLAKQYHPDVNPTEEASVHFLEIHEAYDYLTSNYPDLHVHNDIETDIDIGGTVYYYRNGTVTAFDGTQWIFEYGFNEYNG